MNFKASFTMRNQKLYFRPIQSKGNEGRGLEFVSEG